MKRKCLIILFLVVFSAVAFASSLLCFAETPDAEFRQIIEKMRSSYESFLSGEGEILTTAYFGYINNGKTLIELDENKLNSDDIAEFYTLENYYLIEKTSVELEKTLDSSTWRVIFDDKTVLFYSEQWYTVEAVYNQALETVKNASVGTDFDAIFDTYRSAVLSLTDRTEVDAKKTQLVAQNIKIIDFEIISAINEKLSASSLPAIDETLYVEYRWNEDNSLYLEFLGETLSKGYSASNLVAVTVLHSSALEKLNSVSIFATDEEYTKITENALSEIKKIEINNVVHNDYILSSAKESAILTLTSFFENDTYLSANKKTKKEFENIINQAIENIRNATDSQEILRISTDAQEKLAEVDTKGSGWIIGLSIGVVLLVLAVGGAVAFGLYRNKIGKKQESDKLKRQQRIYAEKIINSALNAKENKHNDE